jgi:hypothetical protein
MFIKSADRQPGVEEKTKQDTSMKQAARPSKTLVDIQWTILNYIPED